MNDQVADIGFYEEHDEFNSGWQENYNQGGPMFPGPPFMGRPHGPYPWGRGFGPAGPPIVRPTPDIRPIGYLIRCGVPKELLRNLPRELLQLIQPESCGICKVSLESFDVSRAHYTSKGHMRRQKNWSSQQNFKHNIMRKQQQSFAPRDVYCELCDVEITSKLHADSHYSGKPHRSIVEGRRNPKNSLLLASHMADRLVHLIRREKKHLKNCPEPEIQTPVQEKPVPAELYCGICKTTVTNSEQMTMHLNGKKHLAKEKQHIMKLMKGETSDNENEEVTNKDGDGPEEEEDEYKYDWGDGSQKWEEDEEEPLHPQDM